MNFINTFEEGYGQSIIVGLNINHGSYDPIAQIWSAIRKKARKTYHIDAAGTFSYPSDETIVCKFFLNYAQFDSNSEKQKQLLHESFKTSFPYMMQLFMEAIDTFVQSPEGLQTYEKIAESGLFEELNKSIDDFLKQYGYRPHKK